jgi:hypothetical protein
MDPLSIIASVLTVTEALLKGFQAFQKLRNAHSDVQGVVEDLEKFHAVFKQTEEVLTRPRVFADLSGQAKEALSLIAVTAEAELTRCSLLLTEKVAKSKDGAAGDIEIHYTAWLRYGKEIKRACAKLHELQASLVLVNGTVAVYDSYLTCQPSTQLANIGLATRI